MKLFAIGLPLVLFTLGPSAAVSQNSTTGRPIVFSHVSLISMKADGVMRDQTVVIRGGKITKIGPSSEVLIPTQAIRIDGADKFLMPGLADLHVHLFSGDDLLSYLSYGVTTVLNMDGSPMHLRWRTEVREGKLLGPTIYTASHTIDGVPPLNEMFLTAENPTDAAELIVRSKKAGYDFIKVYGTLRPEVFSAILASASRENIPVVGHVNRQIGALEVLKSRQVLAAHLEDLMFARFDRPPADSELITFANAIAASGVTVTPNLNVNPSVISQLRDLAAVLASPDAALLPPAAYSQWMPTNNRNEREAQTATQIESLNEVQRTLYRLVSLLRARGVPLVLGTDAAAYGFPGLSVHQELKELIEAGFSPYQALLTATRNPGVFISQHIPAAPHFGTLEEGSEADLVLLSANPLADIDNAKTIAGVMLKGRWLSSAELTSLEVVAKARSSEVKRLLGKIDSALASGHVADAQKIAKPLENRSSPWIAEWVLIAKARRLQSAHLASAIQVAQWNARLYSESFAAHYVLADLLFRAGSAQQALTEANTANVLEPSNATTQDLLEKIQSMRSPVRFTPSGTYRIQYTNGVSGEEKITDLHVVRRADGRLVGTKTDPGGEQDTPFAAYAGGNRLWIVADTPFGSQEFRLIVKDAKISGRWTAPFGRNGSLTGTKVK